MSRIYEDRVKEILANSSDDGKVKSRESTSLEFKESFGFKSLAKYLKTICAFSNTQGGVLVFGVTDNPRTLKGIDKYKFDQIKIEQLSTYLSEYFSPEIHWDIGVVTFKRKHYGFIAIKEADDKPVICKKNSGDVLKDGDIYYRYRGTSKRIEFPELKRMQIEIREKERKLWMEHIEKISRIGPKNVALLDLYSGKMESSNIANNFVIDEELLAGLKNEVSFVQEGNFKEKEGAPTLKLVGNLAPVDTVVVPNLDPNKDYPFLVKHLADELQIRSYDAQVLVWKLGLKSSKRYAIEVDAGSSSIFKYSKYALTAIRDDLAKHDDKKEYLANASKEYQSRNMG
ncbi:ATP-binding protein [Marinobacter vulgaris]|uniref:ATP-binding protein n=1 Tax=Marinobacter vulgaris TaxID=1928331 RepID=A0A2V3ZT73_9GAMM|nr:ATP-binding protein [Marinobacter vulgaris]PXX93813.1 ATP-binding protein [Marinobacter vulgaris]TSJ72167.1 ATP-binding protein [Marinobacter vulgaris]